MKAWQRGALVVCLWCVGVLAQDLPPEMQGAASRDRGPKALQLPLDNTWKPPEATLRIPLADTPQSVSLSLPALPQPEGSLAVLRFRVRLKTEGFGGWNNCLSLALNGTVVEANTKGGTARILNRAGPAMKTSDSRWPAEAYFKRANGPVALLTPYGPDWDTLEPRFISERGELYWFVLDISDLVNADAANTLTLTNLALAKWWNKPPEALSGSPLLVDRLEVGLASKAARDAIVDDPARELRGFTPVADVESGAVTVAVAAGGAVRIRQAGDEYFLTSGFSEPGPGLRWNRLALMPAVERAVTVSREGAGLRVTLAAPNYRLDRTVVPEPPFIRVSDTLTNTGTSVVGIQIWHSLIAARPAQRWHLSGMLNAPAQDWTADNPTAHLAGERTGMGLAIRDSVLRGQMTLEGSPTVVRVVDDHFGLAAGAAYTCAWALYAGGPDYWEFINAVRRDWNANYTLPGTFGFWYAESEPVKSLMQDPAKMRAYLARKRIDLFAVTPWFEYYYPARDWTPRSVYKETVQKQMAVIKAVQPNAKVIACLESFLYYQPESFFQGTLPKAWTDSRGGLARDQGAGHSVSLGEAGTRIIDATPWRDSVYRNDKGHVEIDLYYSLKYRDGGANLKVFPVPGNTWHSRFMDILDFCLNECGLDGVYIDSFNFYGNVSHGTWDGHTVDIDPLTGAVTRQYARLSLHTRQARREWAKYVTDRGKILVVNGKPDCAEVQDVPMVSFMEAEWVFDPAQEPLSAPRAAQAQLSCPLALGVRPTRWDPLYKTQYAEIVQKAVMAYLRHGALYCHYNTEIPPVDQPGGGEYGVLNHMTPITPIELREGTVIGSERIITAVSGTFAWPQAARPRVLRFDLRGMPVEGGAAISRAGEGWTVRIDLKDWSETAVVEAETESQNPRAVSR